MVIALQKVTQEGVPYQRRQEIECLLEDLDSLEPEQLLERCINAEAVVPFEVLIYYLRHTELGLEEQHLKALFLSFYDRLTSALRRALPDSGLDNADSIREEISGRIIEMIATDRNTQEEKMYYWETNFNHALANLRKDVLKKMGPKDTTDPLLKAISLSHDSDDGSDIRPEVENAVTEFFDLSQSILDDPAFRFRLMTAINELPDNERRAVGLFLQGMQQKTIAKELECTDRTIRNRLARAYATLQDVLQAEEIP